MTKQVRVNVRTAVNSDKIRRERRNGRDVIIVPSATMPDGIVMNRIRYPAEEIAKSFHSLENTPAPLGHPNVEGRFVSASDPEGMVRGFVGAWNTNVRREKGRVWIDKVIDVEYAKQLDGGKAVLNAIEKGEPIHTSTGLYCTLIATNGDKEADNVATGIIFDHDAILIGEDGAATPENGVGIFVNSDGKRSDVDVINSSLEDRAEEELEWALDSAVRSVERMARVPLIERLKSVIKDALASHGPETETKGDEPVMNDAQFKELSGKLDAVGDALKGLSGLGETITNAIAAGLKPMTDQMQANAAAEQAKAKADHAKAVEAVVNAGLLTKEVAEAADIAVLNALVANVAKPAPQAMRLNAAFKPGADAKSQFKMPKAEG